MNHCRPFLKLLYQRIKIMILALHSFMHLAQHYIRVAAEMLVTIDKHLPYSSDGKTFHTRQQYQPSR
jgi:hypothetical protein